MTTAINRPLTDYQTAVLQAVADGDTGQEIAGYQYTSRQAVYSCLEHIRRKLRATNTPQAVAEGFRRKLIK